MARARARRDTVAWCALYCPHVRAPAGGTTPFLPYDYQAQLLRSLDGGGPHIVCKARQIGISTSAMIYALSKALELDNWLALVISRTADAARELIGIARLAYLTARKSAKPALTVDNQMELGFSNGSRIVGERSSEEAGRVFSAGLLILDEAAHLPWQEEMWRSAEPTVERTGNVLVVSTPNGEGDLFERLWSQHTDPAKVGGVGPVHREDSDWKAFRLPWHVHPQRDAAWKRRQLEHMTARDFAQEYECEFVSAGANVFPAEAVQACVELWPEVRDREPSRVTIGVDVAGEGRDESVVTVLDCSASPYRVIEQAAWGRIPAPALQAEIEKRQRHWGGEVAIDYTGVGYGVAQNLDVDHVRITFTGGQAVTGSGGHQRVPRTVLLSNAVQMVEAAALALNPEDRELLRAVQTARWEKARGEFVDRLDSLLLALWLARERGRPFAYATGKY